MYQLQPDDVLQHTSAHIVIISRSNLHHITHQSAGVCHLIASTDCQYFKQVRALEAAEAARRKEAAKAADRLKQKGTLDKQRAERAKVSLSADSCVVPSARSLVMHKCKGDSQCSKMFGIRLLCSPSRGPVHGGRKCQDHLGDQLCSSVRSCGQDNAASSYLGLLFVSIATSPVCWQYTVPC